MARSSGLLCAGIFVGVLGLILCTIGAILFGNGKGATPIRFAEGADTHYFTNIQTVTTCQTDSVTGPTELHGVVYCDYKVKIGETEDRLWDIRVDVCTRAKTRCLDNIDDMKCPAQVSPCLALADQNGKIHQVTNREPSVVNIYGWFFVVSGVFAIMAGACCACICDCSDDEKDGEDSEYDEESSDNDSKTYTLVRGAE